MRFYKQAVYALVTLSLIGLAQAGTRPHERDPESMGKLRQGEQGIPPPRVVPSVPLRKAGPATGPIRP